MENKILNRILRQLDTLPVGNIYLFTELSKDTGYSFENICEASKYMAANNHVITLLHDGMALTEKGKRFIESRSYKLPSFEIIANIQIKHMDKNKWYRHWGIQTGLAAVVLMVLFWLMTT